MKQQSSDMLKRKRSIAKKDRETIFDILLDPSLPPAEKTLACLSKEGLIILGAGSETTANTISLVIYHLVNNPAILERLHEELKAVIPTPDSAAKWSDLERLPYLV